MSADVEYERQVTHLGQSMQAWYENAKNNGCNESDRFRVIAAITSMSEKVIEARIDYAVAQAELALMKELHNSHEQWGVVEEDGHIRADTTQVDFTSSDHRSAVARGVKFARRYVSEWVETPITKRATR